VIKQKKITKPYKKQE